MPVPAQATLFNESVANGVTTSFPYQFMIASADDLAVELDGVATTTGFTVTGVGDANGGDIVFSVAPVNGVTVLRYLDPVLKRDTDYQQLGDFQSDVVDSDFDRIWLAIQGIALKLATCVRAPISASFGPLPTPAAGNLLGWNTEGTGFMNYVAQAGTSLVDLAASAGSSLIGFKQSGADTVAGTLFDVARERLSLTQFMTSADRTANYLAPGSVALDYAIDAWIAEVKASGRKGVAPAGRYKRATAWTIDLAGCSGLGLTVEGEGMQRTIFDLTAVSSGVPYQVTDSNGSTGGDTFYLSLSNFGVHTNINGVGAALGKNDLSDALNACVFDRLYFANASTGASACALEVNYVVQSYLNVTTNCGASAVNGDSLRLRQVQFSTVTGSGGNAANSMHITGGYTFGNTILNWDAEEVQKCFLIDVATANSNTFIGGQLVWTVGGIDATAGSNNIFMNPNFGVGSNKVLNSTGIAVVGDGNGYGTLVGPNTTVRPPAGDAVHIVDAVAGQQASYIFMRNGVKRWQIRMDNSSESGSNAGSTLVITRFDDSGANLGDAFYITRSNGQSTLAKASIQQVGFFGNGVQTSKPTVSGARAGNAALTSLISALSNLGLINDTTSA